jgi:hypothetical protein
MPRRAILEPKKRVDLTEKYISILESEIAEGDSEAARTLALYRHIDRLGSGISKEDRFYFLACSNLQIKAECPFGHYSEPRYFHYCRRRYWCSNCLFWSLGSQQMRWMSLIRSNIASTEFFHFGPMVRMEWTIPDPLDLDHLRSFTRYMEQTWPAKLTAAWVPAGSWIMARAYDPIESKIRAVYLGPSAQWSMICSNRKKQSKKFTSGLTALDLDIICNKSTSERGKFTPWQPRMVGHPEYLSDVKLQRLTGPNQAIEFWRRIEKGIRWVVGSVTPMLHLDPAKALKLSRLYSKRRLFATHGQIYGQKIITAFDGLTDHDNATILVEHRTANNRDVDFETHNPLMLTGTADGETAPRPCDLHETVQDKCPECKRALVLKVGETGFRRRRPQMQ